MSKESRFRMNKSTKLIQYFNRVVFGIPSFNGKTLLLSDRILFPETTKSVLVVQFKCILHDSVSAITPCDKVTSAHRRMYRLYRRID